MLINVAAQARSVYPSITCKKCCFNSYPVHRKTRPRTMITGIKALSVFRGKIHWQKAEGDRDSEMSLN